MGKTVENELKTNVVQKIEKKETKESNVLPIPVPDEKILYQKFRGKSVIIFEGQIVGVASSLNEAYEKIENIVPKGKRCRIRYIEEGIAIYGLNF